MKTIMKNLRKIHKKKLLYGYLMYIYSKNNKQNYIKHWKWSLALKNILILKYFTNKSKFFGYANLTYTGILKLIKNL